MPENRTIEDLTKEFRRLQKQKFSRSGGVEARVLEAICASNGEHWASVRNGALAYRHKPDRINIPFNFIGSRKRKVAGRIASISPTFKAVPDTEDPSRLDAATIVDKLLQAIDEKVDQTALTWETVDWLLDGGVALEYIRWVPNVTIEPMPIRLSDRPDLFEFFPEASPDDLLWTDHQSPNPEILVPETYRQLMIQQGRAPESFDVAEELESVGDVVSEIYGPLQVFVDSSVRDITKLAPEQSISVANIRTKDWIIENFEETAQTDLDKLNPDEDIRIVRTNLSRVGYSVGGVDIMNLLPAIQGSRSTEDPDMFVVVERFQDRSKAYPDGRYTVYIPGQAILLDGPNPYEDGIPFVAYHWQPPTTTFFTKNWTTDLIPPTKAFDRFMSDMFEYFAKFGMAPWLGGGNIKLEDFQGPGGDTPRFIEDGLSPEGRPLVQQADVAQVPPILLQLVNNLKSALDDLAGGSDLFSENRFPGQLRGSMTVPMLQEILDGEYGPVFRHLAKRMAQAKQKRINRVKQFYPPLRTLHYTSRSDRVEVFEFHTDEILRTGTEYNITIEEGSVYPELRMMREARVKERLEGPLAALYIDDRTGALDKTKIAADLQMGDTGREAREAKTRKLARDIIHLLWQGKTPPQPQPWMDPAPMLDEFEEAMNDMDFLKASDQIQQGFMAYWQGLMQMAQQAAQQQQAAMQQQAVQAAVNQASQQAAARAGAETSDAVMDQVRMFVQQTVQQMLSDPGMLAQVMSQVGMGQEQ